MKNMKLFQVFDGIIEGDSVCLSFSCKLFSIVNYNGKYKRKGDTIRIVKETRGEGAFIALDNFRYCTIKKKEYSSHTGEWTISLVISF